MTYLIKCRFCEIWDSPTTIISHYKRKHPNSNVPKEYLTPTKENMPEVSITSIIEAFSSLEERLTKKLIPRHKEKSQEEKIKSQSSPQKAQKKSPPATVDKFISPSISAQKNISQQGTPLLRNKPISQRIEEIKLRGKSRRPSGTLCPLCGNIIERGKMLEHKEKIHNELRITPSPASTRRNTWVSIYQGGLPSLGKNSK